MPECGCDLGAGAVLRAAVAAILLSALPAAALTPPAPCLMDGGSLRILTPEAHGAATGRLFDVFPAPRPGGFVDWTWNDGTNAWIVLQHCATDQFIVVRSPLSLGGPVQARYEQMVESQTPHSLHQVAEALGELGAQAEIGRGGLGRCGCMVNLLD
ncbi:MAG: hypothetical protein KJZ85_06940 [Rhodobacteraceae bacterium]|nr:hypothetical protein [Paracoccaceae bacterium]